MKTYKVVDAKANLSRLIQEALDGKTVTIGRRNEPLVKLVRYTPGRRRLGLYDGQGWMADDFNAPLEDFEEYE